VLDSALQTAGGIKSKWTDRSRIGIYLGRSPIHARSVALVLNIDTGRVSPQYHVQFDPSFQTIRKSWEASRLILPGSGYVDSSRHQKGSSDQANPRIQPATSFNMGLTWNR
jgi:hypothetical protein